ncbi:Gfo/Idh/MocA family protein [Mangrovihabitans endophyticus]|uniref:Oxidoreductase n=1 Tax=Mangrovihabitans endophyticus TaxID=1751298 RepID=A0A8J3FLE6_9ACTN|nr:Gfo/Idh/MocA family oxidoreductase [Mangrovihabitans endophyticus]GGK77369.1 oxidoreductase [Mangrovihabitans endophyticus]
MSTPARVVLIGANGHGRTHRATIAAGQAAGILTLTGVAEPQPLHPDPPLPSGVPVFHDHRELLAATAPEVAVICTPPHTHLAIATDALAAGCDLLLEKPPVVTLAEHVRLLAAVRRSGRACQVGFQALGSAALTRLLAAVSRGELGTVTGLATLASWRREDAYYERAPWAGRQRVAGRRGLDGALVNPLAHAVMQTFAVASAAGAGEPARLEAERYRVRPIETDDTAFARVTFRSGLRMTASVTLAGEDFLPGEVIVAATRGRAVLEYPTDRLALPADPRMREVPGRVDLLTNLIAHRRSPADVPLLAPLARTAGFTAFAEALTDPDGPRPSMLDGDLVTSAGEPPQRVRVIRGINALLRRTADTGALPSELGVAWATRPRSTALRQPAGNARGEAVAN